MACGGLNKYMHAAAKIGSNPVSKRQIQLENGDEQADANPSRETKFSGANWDRKILFSLFSLPRAALTTLPDWSLLLLYVMTMHAYIHSNTTQKHYHGITVCMYSQHI